MPTKEKCVDVAKQFRSKHGIEASDENLIATIHLVNKHGIHPDVAIVQSSQSGNDHGIDAWHYWESQKALSIYQSKLTDSKALAFKGLKDLTKAVDWLGQVIVNGVVQHVPSGNTCLFNLYTLLSKVRTELKSINLTLLSPFNENELEESREYQEFSDELSRSALKAFLSEQVQGKLTFQFSEYDLNPVVLNPAPSYLIPVLPETRLSLQKGPRLDLAYIPLHSLVELYRRLGDILFDKNVRLSLAKTRETKERLVSPMVATMDLISNGEADPNLFAFYHVGVTITALRSSANDRECLDLESPRIINGCQTITIATAYLETLKKQENYEAIERFKQIKVVAKVVIGASNDETREITNANNRQNPIENWQLFSNEPIHIEIETLLRDAGVFYERQKGKYETLKDCGVAKHYPNTNGTFIKVLDLAQVIALTRGDLDLAGKPSKIFASQGSHNKIFDSRVPNNAEDIIFLCNVFKANKCALTKYLARPVHVNSNAGSIFGKTPVRMHTLRLALMYFYKNGRRRIDRAEYSTKLYKIANHKLVAEAEIFYTRVISKTRNWYTEKSKDLQFDISSERLDTYFRDLATEVGMGSVEDQLPFAA